MEFGIPANTTLSTRIKNKEIILKKTRQLVELGESSDVE